MKALLIAAIAALATPAMAQDAATPLDAFADQADGKEVTASGVLAKLPGGGDFFFSLRPGQHFPVEFALDRDALAKVQDCEAETPCDVTIKAETQMPNYFFGLLIYEITFN